MSVAESGASRVGEELIFVPVPHTSSWAGEREHYWAQVDVVTARLPNGGPAETSDVDEHEPESHRSPAARSGRDARPAPSCSSASTPRSTDPCVQRTTCTPRGTPSREKGKSARSPGARAPAPTRPPPPPPRARARARVLDALERTIDSHGGDAPGEKTLLIMRQLQHSSLRTFSFPSEVDRAAAGRAVMVVLCHFAEGRTLLTDADGLYNQFLLAARA